MIDDSEDPALDPRRRRIVERGVEALEWVEEWTSARMAREGEGAELRTMRDEASLLRGRLRSFLDLPSAAMAGLALLTSGLDLAFLDQVLDRTRSSGGGGHRMALRRLRDFLYESHHLEPPGRSFEQDVSEDFETRSSG